jgi:hypothetical protein
MDMTAAEFRLVRHRSTVAWCAVGMVAGLIIATPPALADPQSPAPPPAPVQNAAQTVTALPAPPDGMPHLTSPENLPPGTTDVGPPEDPGASYLREIWNAIQQHQVSVSDALLLLAQMPMDTSGLPPTP